MRGYTGGRRYRMEYAVDTMPPVDHLPGAKSGTALCGTKAPRRGLNIEKGSTCYRCSRCAKKAARYL